MKRRCFNSNENDMSGKKVRGTKQPPSGHFQSGCKSGASRYHWPAPGLLINRASDVCYYAPEV